MIPEIAGGYFPPRNKAGRQPGFARALAADLADEEDYVYGGDDRAPRALVPLSLSEMLASPVEVLHEAADAQRPAGPLLASRTFASLEYAVHVTDTAPQHAVDNQA
jgi:hypothetical protein